MIWPFLATLAAYLIGSLSFAVIVSRAMGLADPRSYGSGNPGATNVLRSGSRKAAIVTLPLDAAKGWLPVVLAQAFGADFGLGAGTQALAGLAAFLGHLYPVFFRFQGGKGVATALGVLLAFEPCVTWAALRACAVILVFFRSGAGASGVAAVFARAYSRLGAGVAWTASGYKTLALMAMGVLLIWRHRENIRRLLAGTESKLGSKKK